MRNDLHIDWATHGAASYACKKWHYSKSLPPPPHIRFGVWEQCRFIGAVMFARGANNNLLKPYGLSQTDGCELVRVALGDHKSHVSKIIAICIRKLKAKAPGLQLIVSMADPFNDHHGGIYQAGNWLYAGTTNPTVEYLAPDGKIWHGRMVSKTGIKKVFGKKRRVWKHSECSEVLKPGKHKYLMPLSREMREKIQHLSKPYPKRVQSIDSDVSSDQLEEGGVSPTCTLQGAVNG